MGKNLMDGIKEIINTFNDSLNAHLPALQTEVTTIIEGKSSNSNEIENCLDTLLSLTIHSVADHLFIQLLEYYKIVDLEGAMYYWNEYDDKEE